MRDNRIRYIAIAALFTAMVAMVTYAVRIPIKATGGYLNFGDIIIFLTAILLGGKMGFIVGGLGAALADLFSAPFFALFTFFIKGAEGYITGRIATSKREEGPPSTLKMTLAALLGGLWMVAGYFIIESIVIGVGAAVAELAWNLLQVGMGILVSVPLAKALLKINVFKNMQ